VVKDNCEKIVLTMDKSFVTDYAGIRLATVRDFLCMEDYRSIMGIGGMETVTAGVKTVIAKMKAAGPEISGAATSRTPVVGAVEMGWNGLSPAALIRSIDKLPAELRDSASSGERVFVEGLGAAGRLPFAVTPHFASLARPEAEDPIRRQFFPDPQEALSETGPFALPDPLGEGRHRVSPRLVHQYPDRVLLLAGGACAGYCRHCFRRVRMSGGSLFITEGELEPVLSYLGAHPEIREVLVSGGDPLMAPDRVLEDLFAKLRRAAGTLALRVCTRVPITDPPRLGPATAAMLSAWKPLRVSVHINHPRELDAEARRVLGLLTGAGIPVLVQTVLLKGINDSAEILAALFRDCLDLGLKPYYLFQLDLAPGIAHFRVPLGRGLALYRELEKRWTTVGGETAELPPYAVDLPGGGGKIRLSEQSIAGREDRPGAQVYLLRAPDGSLWPYPAA
jgi:lysine 2,3-aminomutase